MSIRPSIAALAVLLALTASFGAPVIAKSAKKSAEPKAEAALRAVPAWLVLGPVAEPLPAFHDAATGQVKVDDLLEAQRFATDRPMPREGQVEPWFAGAGAAWTRRETGGDGGVTLVPPDGAAAERPAGAWLAAYVDTATFRRARIEVVGSGPRAVWVDGRKVASGSGEKVEGTVDLEPGTHAVVLRSLTTSADGWRSGLRWGPAKDAAPFELSWSTAPAGRLGIERLLEFPGVDNLDIAADGTLAALTLERVRPGTDREESWVEVRSTADGRLVRTWRGSGSLTQVQWAPRGHVLTFVSSRDGKSGLWLVDLDAGTETALLEDVERFGSYRWSPKGDAVLYATAVEPPEDKSGVKRVESLLDRQAGFRTKSYLHLVTVPDGVRRRLTAGPESTSLLDVAPDGSRALFSRRVEDLSRPPYSVDELWEIDLATSKAMPLRTDAWMSDASYSPDGRKILVLGGPSMFGGAGNAAGEGVVPNDYDGQLYVWTPGTSDVVPLTRSFDPAVVSAVWSPADGKIYAVAVEADRQSLFRLDPEGGAPERIPVDGLEVIEEVEVARESGRAVVRGSGVWRPEAALALGPQVALYDASEGAFADVARGEVRPFAFEASTGVRVDGRVYLPVPFDASRKYPAIVYFYGGTAPVERDFGGRYPKEWWASLGYVVYVLQPSGATGYGQAFSARHVNAWGGDPIREIVEGTTKFLEAHPFVDPARVGAIGASYGGYTTMRLLAETDRFAAAVSHAGISTLSSYWGEGYWGYSYNGVAARDSFPWNRRDVYVDQSPLFLADRIKTPLLLTHGASDTNVPAGESAQLFVALRMLGAPVEYLSIEGQDHWILDHAKRVRWSKSIMAWFDRWLKAEPGWWDALYPPPGAGSEAKP